MKIPSGISADWLIRALEHFGYTMTRQKGKHVSLFHVRLYHEGPFAHSITVPLHDPLKTSTLKRILEEVARAQSISIETILDQL